MDISFFKIKRQLLSQKDQLELAIKELDQKKRTLDTNAYHEQKAKFERALLGIEAHLKDLEIIRDLKQ